MKSKPLSIAEIAWIQTQARNAWKIHKGMDNAPRRTLAYLAELAQARGEFKGVRLAFFFETAHLTLKFDSAYRRAVARESQ